MEFELPVKTILKEKGSDFIDGYIPSTKVLIEQKGSKVDLGAKYRQSDGLYRLSDLKQRLSQAIVAYDAL